MKLFADHKRLTQQLEHIEGTRGRLEVLVTPRGSYWKREASASLNIGQSCSPEWRHVAMDATEPNFGSQR